MIAGSRHVRLTGLLASQRGCRRIWITVLSLLPVAMSAPPAMASSATWTRPTSGGFWSTPGNWAPSNPSGIDAIADFSTLDITADNTVHFNFSGITIGNMIFGDTTPTNNWIFEDQGNGGSGAVFLVLAVSSGSPTITVNNQTATIIVQLRGSQGFTKAGSGTLVLSAVSEPVGGTLLVSQGTLVQNAALTCDVANYATFISNNASIDGRIINFGVATFNMNLVATNGLENDGVAVVAPGVNITLNGAGLNNMGTIAMTGGTLAVGQGSTNSGSLTFAAGTQLALGASTFNNNGAIYLNGGLITGAGGQLSNNFGGVVAGPGTILSTFSNSGGLLSVSGGTTIISQGFDNGGFLLAAWIRLLSRIL